MMQFALDGGTDGVPALPLESRFAAVYAQGLDQSDSPLVDADLVSELFDEVLERDPAARGTISLHFYRTKGSDFFC